MIHSMSSCTKHKFKRIFMDSGGEIRQVERNSQSNADCKCNHTELISEKGLSQTLSSVNFHHVHHDLLQMRGINRSREWITYSTGAIQAVDRNAMSAIYVRVERRMMAFESYPLQITLDLLHLLEWGGKDEVVILSPANVYALVACARVIIPLLSGATSRD